MMTREKRVLDAAWKAASDAAPVVTGENQQ